MSHVVALFSGGLDSMVAARLMQEEGFEVDALHVVTFFEGCGERAAQAAAELGIRLAVRSVGSDYAGVICRPLHGYGKGANPCVDCRIYMARMAKQFMEELGACAVITGEVLGQRPMSQKYPDLGVIACESGLEGRLLRPLCALRLPPTLLEREGRIARDKLFGFSGRGRFEIIALARRLGIGTIPGASSGCALVEPEFAARVHDLVRHEPGATRWDFQLLQVGRHFRLHERVKAVLSRNEHESRALGELASREDASQASLLEPANFRGPSGLIVGPAEEDALRRVVAMIARAGRDVCQEDARVRVHRDGSSEEICLHAGDGQEPLVKL